MTIKKKRVFETITILSGEGVKLTLFGTPLKIKISDVSISVGKMGVLTEQINLTNQSQGQVSMFVLFQTEFFGYKIRCAISWTNKTN